MKKTIRIGIIGMGGFAGAHHKTVANLEARGECRLICTCDPDLAKFAGAMAEWSFRQRGVRVFDDYKAMLAECAAGLDMLVVPTPVPLHAPMHRAGVECGLPVYLEKPPTLDFRELDAMLAVEARAVKATQVGFNHIGEPPRRLVKRRLTAGEFGRLIEVGFLGVWPRADQYFQRAAWAGRLMMGDGLVLDSCMGNALGHHMHNLLFWAGSDEDAWAGVGWVEAEMYRAHAIEGTDTIFLRAGLDNGVRLVTALSHACIEALPLHEWLICEKARIQWLGGEKGLEIAWNDGRLERVAPDPVGLIHNHLAYYAYLRGETARPLTRLIDTRPFVQLCDLAYVAAGRIHQIPAACIDRRQVAGKPGMWLQIDGIPKAASRFVQSGAWPGEQNLSWAKAAGRHGGRATAGDLPLLPEVIKAMVADASGN